jgi:hypothetical protein
MFEAHLELFIDTLQTINCTAEGPNLVTPHLELLLEIGNFTEVGVPLGSILGL